jgi:hypothetical protein
MNLVEEALGHVRLALLIAVLTAALSACSHEPAQTANSAEAASSITTNCARDFDACERMWSGHQAAAEPMPGAQPRVTVSGLFLQCHAGSQQACAALERIQAQART